MATNSLSKRVKDVGRAKHYYDGVRRETTPLPDNIICFSHERVSGPARAYHHRFMLLHNFGERGIVWLDDHMLPFSQGDVLLIFPFQYHGYLENDDASAWLFTTFEMESWDHLTPLRNRAIPALPSIKTFTESLLDDYTQATTKDARRGSRMSLAVAAILEEALRLQAAGPMQGRDLAFLTPRLDVLRRLQQLIFSSIDQPTSIDELAAELHVSSPHLRFLFRREFGISLGRHIRELKMAHASKLLATSEMAVTEVGEHCGYDSVYSFSRAFKSIRGESPSAYRHRYQG
jgi:AraC-like DNA-binding protein